MLFNCPTCQKKLNVADKAIGKVVDCPNCGGPVVTEPPKPPPDPPRPVAPPPPPPVRAKGKEPVPLIDDETESQQLPSQLPKLRDIACLCCLPVMAIGTLMMALKVEPRGWEYRVEFISDTSSFSSQLDYLGKDGWEVASARRASSGEDSFDRYGYEFILKRRR